MVIFFCYCTLSKLQHSVNITFICTEKPKNSFESLLLQYLLYCNGWSGAEPTMSLRYVCIARLELLGIYSHLCRDGFRDPAGTKIQRCSSPLYKMAQYLHITYAHPPIYFNSSLDYVQYLIQCKCYVNSCWGMASSGFIFWNFLQFFLNIFIPSLAEFVDVESITLCTSSVIQDNAKLSCI